MRYNNLTTEGKEEIKQLVKVQIFDMYEEILGELILEETLKKQNPEVTLFVDFKKVDAIRMGMIKLEENDDKEIIESYDKNEGSNISDDEI